MKWKKGWWILAICVFLIIIISWKVCAEKPQVPQQLVLPDININQKVVKGGQAFILPFQILILFSILSLAPYILAMMTAFIRVAIVLSFVRSALGTQQVPPNQVLMGLTLFVTFYIMAPVVSEVNEKALQPYINDKITQQEALERGAEPVRRFLFAQTRDKDLMLFLELAKIKKPPQGFAKKDVPIHVLVPAFMVSEIKTAFQIGFLIYIPFLVIDMIVASILMSMGMFMLSPTTISLPFKLLMFVLVDGWGMIIRGVVQSFRY